MTHFDEGFTFIWKIENFSMLPHQIGEKLESPKFVVEFLDKTTWCLWLYPKGKRISENGNYLSLFLCRCDCDKNKTALKVNYSLTLESVNNALEHSKSLVCDTFDSANTGWGYLDWKVLHVNLYAPHDILTIRCHMLPSQEQCNVPAITRESTTLSNCFKNQYSARTTIDVHRRVLTWPITKISKLEKSQEKIFINLENSSKVFPTLKISFYIDKTLNDKHARIDILQTGSSENECLFVKCKMTVTSANDKHQTSSQASHLFSSNLDEIWHFPDFILIENIGEKYAYVDDTMFLQCEFIFSCKGREHHFAIPMHMPVVFAEKERTESTEVSKRVQALFKSKKFCDVELRAGDQTFPCHKLIICALSPVFAVMFENDMKEKETSVVEITDVEPQILEKLLNFLYQEVVEEGLSVEEICKLYSAADKYEVLLLQRRCSLLLLSMLSVESVCRILVLTDTHQDSFLLTHVHIFLSFHARVVFHSPEWKTFMVDNPKLSRHIMIKIFMEEPYV